MSLARRLGVLFVTSALLGCGAAQHPDDAQTTVVSLQEIDCSTCGFEIIEDLRQQPGVYSAEYDADRAEVTVVASREFDVFTRVRRIAATEGFDVTLGAGKGSFASDRRFPEQADYRRIVVKHDQELDIGDVLAEGKVTVVDFSATWCVPCRKVDAHLRGVLATDEGVAYRKVDIGNWDAAVAEQYLQNVPALPYVIVFSPRGQVVATVSGLDLEHLDWAIAKASEGTQRKPRGQP